MNDTKKIKAMTEGGKRLIHVRKQLVEMLKPGLRLVDIDQKAEILLLETGGEPAFKRVPKYHWSTCININDGVVHGIPNKYKIKSGDLVSIDVGLFYQGYYTDTSITVPVGPINSEIKHFLKTGKKALKNAINETKLGNHIGHISQAIQKTITDAGYHVSHQLTGHGIGKELHENPRVPGDIKGNPLKTPALKLNQTLALEVIYTLGSPELITKQDGWTISTQDGKIAGLFEETVAVTESGPVVLTK